MSINFYIFEHYQLWMMDGKAQRVFFPKTPKLCVWHTEVRNCYHFKLVIFSCDSQYGGALVNRLMNSVPSTSVFGAISTLSVSYVSVPPRSWPRFPYPSALPW